AGAAMLEAEDPPGSRGERAGTLRGAEESSAPVIAAEVRRLARERGGLLRDGPGLAQALSRLEALAAGRTLDAPGRSGLEARNLALVAAMVARCALFREESRGAHYRTDHPLRDDEAW